MPGPSTGADPEEALRSLGFGVPLTIAPVVGGWDTAIWRFATADGLTHVLRVYRSADRGSAAERERAALVAATRAGLPVPAVEAFGSWRERPAVVLSWCLGEPMMHQVARRPWALWRLGQEFGRLQARIHSVPVPDELRAGAPRYWLARAGGGAGMNFSYLDGVGLDAATFVHMDFHPLNVLSDGGSVTGIVDWTNAAAGDRRADLAWTTTVLRVAPLPPTRLAPVLALGRRLFYLAWRRGYEARAGGIPDLAPFLVWAGTVFLREALPRLSEEQVWATDRDLERVRRWIAHWAEIAGIDVQVLPRL